MATLSDQMRRGIEKVILLVITLPGDTERNDELLQVQWNMHTHTHTIPTYPLPAFDGLKKGGYVKTHLL